MGENYQLPATAVLKNKPKSHRVAAQKRWGLADVRQTESRLRKDLEERGVPKGKLGTLTKIALGTLVITSAFALGLKI